MSYSRDQLVFAARTAMESGDQDMARQIGRRIMAMDAESAQASTEETYSDVTSGAGEEFLVGVGKGMTDVGRGAQDLWYRLTGNDKAIAELDARSSEEDAMFERDLGDSGWATAGEITGEVAATLPLGMGVTGAATKAGVNLAARSGSLAAAEGALSEGLTQRGGAAERGLAGAQGALGGKLSDSALKLLGRSASRLTSKVRKPIPDGADRITQAAEDGGYTLDSMQASQNTDALYRRKYLTRNNEDMADMALQQEKDILAKADSFLARMGGYRDPNDLPKDARSRAAEGLARTLRGLKDADDAEVDKFYRQWREAAGDDPIPVIGLREAGERPFDDVMVAVDKEVGGDVREVFNKYFMGELDSGSRLMDASGNPFGARSTSLTVGNYEKLQQELNAIFRRTNNGDARNFIGKVKDSLNEHVSLSFQRISDDGVSTLNKGRKATEAYKENLKKWSRDDFLTKMTDKGPDGEMFRMNPKTSFDRLLAVGNKDMLQKAKSRMLLSRDPTVRESWQRMAQVPLLEAIEAARKSGGANAANDAFSVKTFRNTLSKYDSETLGVLWGKETLNEVKRAMSAWDLKDAASSIEMVSKRQNPSGTAAILHNTASAGVRLLASTPVIGPKLLAIPAAFRAVSGMAAKYADANDVRRIADGKLPSTIEKELKARAREAFTDELVEKYPLATHLVMTQMLREAVQHKNDNE